MPALRVAGILLFAAVAAFGQQQVNLTADPTSVTLPDGSTVPMWGYSCGTAVTGSTATCAALNPNAGTHWSPVVITVPTTATGGLTINLTNNLSFAAGTGTNTVPTSIMIVGQIGGGLGTSRTTTASPIHNPQSVTWPTANTGPTNMPPPQGPRVQSFSTEVAAGATTLLPAWANLRPGNTGNSALAGGTFTFGGGGQVLLDGFLQQRQVGETWRPRQRGDWAISS